MHGDTLTGQVRTAADAAACCAQLLMQHYSTVVEPAVEVSPSEAASCATGLAALTRAVEDRIIAALAASLSYLASQVHCCNMAPVCGCC